MKKLFGLVAVILSLMIIVSACGGSKKVESSVAASATSEASGSKSGAQAEQESGEITLAEAKKIALDHAGVKEEDAVFVKEKLDYDDGRKEYEIEFYSDNLEYDYEIDAITGDIISFDKDIEDFAIEKKDTDLYIGEEKAKEIALAEIEGASEVDIAKFKLDNDDGRAKYEGIIIYSGTKYEFEIDAETGDIIEWETEKR